MKQQKMRGLWRCFHLFSAVLHFHIPLSKTHKSVVFPDGHLVHVPDGDYVEILSTELLYYYTPAQLRIYDWWAGRRGPSIQMLEVSWSQWLDDVLKLLNLMTALHLLGLCNHISNIFYEFQSRLRLSSYRVSKCKFSR